MAGYSELDERAVNTVRVLAADVVEKAKSGHPGMPMGMAPAAHVVWTRFMKFASSKSKNWPARDRFVLSNGHGCALYYVLLHLGGFKVTMDDLKSFRQLGSCTPGHPEAHDTDGIEVTTGPLGQGISNAVGLAIGQAHNAAVFNKPDFPLLDNYTYVFCGDGCLQEGVSSEACSLAGHLKLGNLIVIYDDNKITIDGDTSLSFTEDVLKRYEAYGWHTLTVEGGNTDLDAIDAAIKKAQEVKDRPSIIALKTIIGYLSGKQGTHGVHGAPLGAEDLKAVKQKVGVNPGEFFVVPEDVRNMWNDVIASGEKAYGQWVKLFDKYKTAFPEEAAKFERVFNGKLPEGWKEKLPTFSPSDDPIATRKTSAKVLNAIAEAVPEFIGGSADLTPSTLTALNCSHDFQAGSYDGRYLRFGVREHGMFAIGNGIAAYGGLIPFTSTFLNFVSYCFPAVRLAAISHHKHVMVATHDSIFLGEDGPTHQQVEILSLLRATPGVLLLRPADGNEVAGSYIYGIESHDGPSVIALTRQNVPALANSSREKVAKGAYVMEDATSPDAILIATGSEVGLACDAAKSLSPLKVRVVSAPCLDLFKEQPSSYRLEVLPRGIPIVSIEAAGPLGWSDYAHFSIAIPAYGASAPLNDVRKKFGFTPEAVTKSVKDFLNVVKSSDYTLGTLRAQL